MKSFQSVSAKLDLKTALTRGSERNDLLLPRAEDKVKGEVGNRFLQLLGREVDRGQYDPTKAYFVRVPKSASATRPAALLNLSDRVVYDALVATLRERIEKYLLGPGIVFWPRGVSKDKSWLPFEHTPISKGVKYVVVADISGFYETVDHEQLADCLIRATGRREEVEALGALLDRVMAAGRGLPQGLEPSDALATAYLADLDYAMIRGGFAYSRHGDDIRIAAETYDDARRAVFTLETNARLSKLLLNGQKTKILKLSTYRRELQSIEDTLAETRKQVLAKRLTAIEEDREELVAAIHEADLEQLGWDFFYHERVSLDDVVDQLRTKLQPSEIEVAENLFKDTWKRRPGRSNELPSDAFHQRIVTALVRLAAGASPVALPSAGELMTSFPDKTEVASTYLLALAPSHPAIVAKQAAKVFVRGRFWTEWEAAWAVRVLLSVSEYVPSYIDAELDAAIADPFDKWLAATEVAKLRAAQNRLEQTTFLRLWNSCPPVFQADLVVAANYLVGKKEWAVNFLSAVRDDRIHEVVLGQLALSP